MLTLPSRERCLGAGILACALAAAAATPRITSAATDAPAAATSLAGRWLFNKQASDDARAKMREAMQNRGERGQGPGGGGMGGPTGGGRGGGGGPMGRGRPPGGGGGDDAREAMRAVLEPAEELVIGESESEIAIDDTYGRTRRLHPDGKKYKADNGLAEVKSYWKDGKLVVETRPERGGSSIETWERVPDGSRLIVVVRLEGGPGGKLELKRIYDRAEPAAGAAPR